MSSFDVSFNSCYIIRISVVHFYFPNFHGDHLKHTIIIFTNLQHNINYCNYSIYNYDYNACNFCNLIVKIKEIVSAFETGSKTYMFLSACGR